MNFRFFKFDTKTKRWTFFTSIEMYDNIATITFSTHKYIFFCGNLKLRFFLLCVKFRLTCFWYLLLVKNNYNLFTSLVSFIFQPQKKYIKVLLMFVDAWSCSWLNQCSSLNKTNLTFLDIISIKWSNTLHFNHWKMDTFCNSVSSQNLTISTIYN